MLSESETLQWRVATRRGAGACFCTVREVECWCAGTKMLIARTAVEGTFRDRDISAAWIITAIAVSLRITGASWRFSGGRGVYYIGPGEKMIDWASSSRITSATYLSLNREERSKRESWREAGGDGREAHDDIDPIKTSTFRFKPHITSLAFDGISKYPSTLPSRGTFTQPPCGLITGPAVPDGQREIDLLCNAMANARQTPWQVSVPRQSNAMNPRPWHLPAV
ncbi:hypothetical protein DFH09DRAFT_1391262 [Mycena vulgaris]|nr:hypothetical protein DFH09DRAFT_1391262 [Mycena vulgaris]